MIALAIVAALVAAGYGALLYLLWRHQERIVFQPPAAIPGEAAEAEQLRYSASDGTPLFAWVVTPDSPRGVVLYFHGNAVIARWMIPWAKEVAQRVGVAVVLAEYRGYDGLTGEPTYAGSSMDSDAALAACCHQFNSSPDELVLYGHSLGSAIAAEVAVRRGARALILEAPFTSAREMSGRWPLVGSWAVWPWLSRIHFDTAARVRQTTVPVHVAHGDRDIVIPVRMGLAVHQAAQAKGELLRLADAGHNDVVVRGGAAYWRWLEQAVRPAGA